MKYCVLFSNQQLADDRKTKRFVLLSAAAPSSQIKQRRSVESSEIQPMILEILGNANMFFILSLSSIDLFFRQVDKEQAKCSETAFILGLLEKKSHFGSPRTRRELKAFEGAAAHVAWSNYSSHKASILGP